jgi:uncharacterized protein (TIGR02246 family)
MKLLIALVTILISTVAFTAQQNASASELTLDAGVKAHEGIDAIYAKFSRAYRELDSQMVIDLYTENAVYMTPDSAIDRGRAHIARTFESFFTSIKQRGGKMSISFQIVERRVSNDMAYDVGIFNLAVSGPDGKPRISKGKFVVIAVKQGKDWKFQLDSYSDLPKPRGETPRN